MKKSGIELIAIEREEQFKKHGRTISDDAIQNSEGELVVGALELLMPTSTANHFPSHWDKNIVAKMVAKTRKERLVIAGAFICAEIDRLNLLEK